MIKVNEIFFSIQGESSFRGYPCVFIRLTGCNCRCRYCDTRYAFRKGSLMSIGHILKRIEAYGCPLVEITGGEPLLQQETPALAQALLEAGYRVLVETNGTLDISLLPPECRCIMDIKCPGSGESEKNDWRNLDRLKEGDEVKCVIMDKKDYEWARDIIHKTGLTKKVGVHLSPVHSELAPEDLAQWILDDRLEVRLHLQLHKIIWPERGVK